MGFNPQMTAKQNIYVNASLLADKGGYSKIYGNYIRLSLRK